jgi:hypothetical protein
VFVLGGLGADGCPIDIFDVQTRKWMTGPALPGADKKTAFSPSAATVGGRVIVNTLAGPVYRLDEKGDGWEQVGAAKTQRMVARMIPLGPTSVALLGGAAPGAGSIAAVEVISLAQKGDPVVTGKQP